jgi:hypothetical protein
MFLLLYFNYCSNYRGISLIPTAYKVFSKIISNRLEPFMENHLHQYQAGFRRGMSTTDQIHCVRQIVQKSNEMNKETHYLFIDFKAAYDSIDREELCDIMVEGDYPYKLIRLARATLQGVNCCVKVQNCLSGYFESKCGLRQGDELSTKLFNIALEGVIRRSEIQLTGSIFSKSVQLFAYADDIDIVGNSLRTVTKAYSNLENEASRVGLVVNELKTKYMFTGREKKTFEFLVVVIFILKEIKLYFVTTLLQFQFNFIKSFFFLLSKLFKSFNSVFIQTD